MKLRHKREGGRALTAVAGLAVVAAATLGACAKSTTNGSSSPAASPASTGAPASAASSVDPATVTFAVAPVPGIGAVLVNGAGKTIYILTSESKGTITCTDASGCTAVWPDSELPAGVSAPVAGSGVDTTKLSTVKSPDGHLYTSYAGYPLYTFAHDSGPGQHNGLGITSFGGTWYPIRADGSLVTATAASPAASKSSGGYGY